MTESQAVELLGVAKGIFLAARHLVIVGWLVVGMLACLGYVLGRKR